MIVQDLINSLFEIEDKTLPVRLAIEGNDNYWVSKLEVSNTGDDGYPIEGEVRLIPAIQPEQIYLCVVSTLHGSCIHQFYSRNLQTAFKECLNDSPVINLLEEEQYNTAVNAVSSGKLKFVEVYYKTYVADFNSKFDVTVIELGLKTEGT